MATRSQRKSELERRRRQRNADANADNLQQAVIKRSDYVECKLLGKVYMSSLSLAEFGEIQQAALRYFRMDRLGYLIDELKMMRDRGLVAASDFNTELDSIKHEVSQLSFDDLPKMTITLDSEQQELEYEKWFMAATIEGQKTAVFAASRYRQPDLTEAQLAQVMKDEPSFFIEAAEVIMSLTNSLIAKK